MSFLQPLLLAGLPLVGLPILIHLIHRQRHRTLKWAAMMFLLDAKRLTRGMARLRFWLIMAMRMLAIACLIFMIARPLASGWMGLAIGGQPDTTIIVLDRSASMEQQDLATGESKRSTAVKKLADLIRTLGESTRIILVENTDPRPTAIESADELTASPATAPTATAADLPAMLQAALDYIVANEAGRTDIWICSDLKSGDWKTDDQRWSALREGFSGREGVRFYLLSYPQKAEDNIAARVENVRLRRYGETAELLLDIRLARQTKPDAPLSFPLELIINGARSVVPVDMPDQEYALLGHTIPLDAAVENGWGRIELPADANEQDNVSYFVFAEPAESRTVIVSDNGAAAEAMRLAVTSPADPAIRYAAEILTPDRAAEIEWSTTALLVWHAPLPSEDDVLAQQMRDFVKSGRPILFMPPESSTTEVGQNAIFGAKWGAWREAPAASPQSVASWRGDSDLLRHARSGTALPVGDLKIYRYCTTGGEGTVLARLADGTPLLTRMSEESGPVYFCATLPVLDHSSLAQDGVVFYVMLHRALATGAATLGNARQIAAGSEGAQVVAQWQPLSEQPEREISSARPYRAGAYQQGDLLLALNRPASEDNASVLDEVAVDRLFSGLDYLRVEDRIDNSSALASEIWRAFLMAAAFALLAEALLCLPDRKKPQVEPAFA